jgi:plastocyanin
MIDFLTRRSLAVGLAAVLALGAAAAVAQQTPPAAEISIKNFKFLPPSLTVASGTAVTWVNNDEEPHNVVNVGGQSRLFKSVLDGGDKYTFVFDKAGTYKYICSVHPRMEGTIIVK